MKVLYLSSLTVGVVGILIGIVLILKRLRGR